MTDENPAGTNDNTTSPETSNQAPEFTPITSQEEFDRRIQARIAQVHRKYADYQELKQAASTHAETLSRAEHAEARIAELEAAALRQEVATAAGVPPVLLQGATRDELEASAAALIEYKDAPASRVTPDPNQGMNAAAGATGKPDFRDLFT
ncbi:hypothetical protein [Nocardia terpenica]|uniref:DUF4355 domain-containing protein n=1 Tax=Nocardia terpenica TaxID=455432 RepID=A0A291RCB3_9NOCA|nr:hypothetical protein [Nocardia terpenica]ATL64937.1 hypothetical protein CRH09_00495 [Nocardia terpenica]